MRRQNSQNTSERLGQAGDCSLKESLKPCTGMECEAADQVKLHYWRGDTLKPEACRGQPGKRWSILEVCPLVRRHKPSSVATEMLLTFGLTKRHQTQRTPPPTVSATRMLRCVWNWESCQGGRKHKSVSLCSTCTRLYSSVWGVYNDWVCEECLKRFQQL